MPHTFTTLRHPVEKLLEAEYFLARMAESLGVEFQFELNAFLSASRNVTFVLQKTMSEIAGFSVWYEQQQKSMKADEAMRFFIEARNISQKQGPVALVGGSLPGGGWTYRFVGQPLSVPDELTGCDVTACCAAHLKKLANLVKGCVSAFPFQSCPHSALTEEGMVALAYDWQDIETAIGLPAGYTEVGEFPASDKLRTLRREFDPLDHEAIERMSNGDFYFNGVRIEFNTTNGADLVDDIASSISKDNLKKMMPRDHFLASILSRIKNTGKL